jgi:RNA polymerase sigma factor (sigma-70 family)
MSLAEIITGLNKNDAEVKRKLFDQYYGKLSAIALRYSKNDSQAREIFNSAFQSVLHLIPKNKNITDQDAFIEKEFVKACAEFVKAIRSEYFVASTVYATERNNNTYDLFEARDIVDFDHVDNDIVVKALQMLVPSQRLIFNLHVLENYDIEESAEILEASLHTVKANLEKARYNLQKNIEKCLKEVRYE